MIEAVDRRVAEFGAQASPGSIFLSDEKYVDEHAVLLPYAHYLHQAWRELDLKGVLCVDGKPVSYLCGAQTFTRKSKKERHSFVWNQGLVPLLIFVTPDKVEVHSAVKSPEREEAGQRQLTLSDDLPSFISTLDTISETLILARLILSIETGQFFQDNASFFPANEAVDRSLLRNLVQTARKLEKKNWSRAQAHALLGRALFVSFLHARQFIKPHYYPHGFASLLDILKLSDHEEVKRLLYKEFFPRLKLEFNGTMFDAELDDEELRIGRAHLAELGFFLGKHDQTTGQMSLGLDDYDFRFIPVEIISAIYEEFMKDADPDKKRDEGAYYTPRHLAETALHVALESRYDEVHGWKILDPACGSGIFLVAMFNLLAEQWRRANASRRRSHTKAQALLEILQTQIKGVDSNLDACRITAFSLYLALFEKLQPIDVDEFKENVRQGPFLPPLVWTRESGIESPVVIHGDFLEEELPLGQHFNLIIGNPPWESRGEKQLALHFAHRSLKFMRAGGLGCLLLPSTLLVNRHGSLDLDWFKNVTNEKIVQLADFRKVLFAATHPCFLLRYRNTKPELNHIVSYETPKLSRFDRRQGVIVIEPDDQKMVEQREVVEAGLQRRLQAVWSRKFWGTSRDEAFLGRLDMFPKLAQVAKKKQWKGGVGFKPYYAGCSQGESRPLPPWALSDDYISNDDNFPQLVLQRRDFITLNEGLKRSLHQKKKVPAALDGLHRKPDESVFTPPMVIFSEGFTKFAFCQHKVFFQNSLRSITGPKADADLLRFLTAVLGSRLMQYHAFHSGSSNGIGRDKMHLYESLNTPFMLPDDDLAPAHAKEIVKDAAAIVKEVEKAVPSSRAQTTETSWDRLEPLVEEYFSVSQEERILIEDTLNISRRSIHRHAVDGDIPSLEFPDERERRGYAKTLCSTLNRYSRKKGTTISAHGMASNEFNLILMTIVFGDQKLAYAEAAGEAELWAAITRLEKAAIHKEGRFSYLRGFSYFDRDRLHMLKPALLRNWSRTAALNDADAIFEYLAEQGV